MMKAGFAKGCRVRRAGTVGGVALSVVARMLDEAGLDSARTQGRRDGEKFLHGLPLNHP